MEGKVEKPKEKKESSKNKKLFKKKKEGTKENTTSSYQFYGDRTGDNTLHKTQQLANKNRGNTAASSLQKMADDYTKSTSTKFKHHENNTGIPDGLKATIEKASGYSMNNVKVHYNSSKPSQFNAKAYAQGNEIHIASGEERYLAHEAWHIVQQKQGRVKPTMHLNGAAINDDTVLEKEADVMGDKLLAEANQYTLDTLVPFYPPVMDNQTTSIQRVKISDELSPKKISKWFIGRGLRAGVEKGISFFSVRVVLNYLWDTLKSYIGQPFGLAYFVQFVNVLDQVNSFWKNLPNEIRVLVHYLVGSVINLWYQDDKKLPDSLIGDGSIPDKAEEGSLDYYISLLVKVTRVLNTPAALIEWLSGKAIDLGSKAVGSLGDWWQSADQESLIAAGFNKQAPPIPAALQSALNKLQEKIHGKEEEGTSVDVPVEEKEEEKASFRQIHIPPMRLGLHEFVTERGNKDEDKSGGLVARAGFQMSLFGRDFPEDFNKPTVEVTMPWLGSGGHYSIKQVQELIVVESANLGILNFKRLGISDLEISDEGLQKVQLNIAELNFGKDVLKISDLSAMWSTKGSQFKATAAFSLGDVAIKSTAQINLDSHGKLSEVSLSNFSALHLPGPFEDFSVERAAISIENGEITIDNAKLSLKEGKGLKDLTLEKLRINKSGEYEAKANTNIQDIELLNGGLKITEFNISGGISSKEGWYIKGGAHLAAQTKGVEAEGKFDIGYDHGKKDFLFEVSGGRIHAEPLDVMTLDAKDISFKDGKLGVGNAELKVNLPADITLRSGIDNLEIDKNGIDWEKIYIGVDAFNLWKFVHFKGIQAELHGKKEDYAIVLRGGVGVDFKEYFGLSGGGAVRYNPKTKKFNLEEVEAEVHGGIKLPKWFIPVWPVNLRIGYPIVPGLEVHGGLVVDGGIGIQLGGKVKKEGVDKPWTILGSVKGLGELIVQIEAGLTAGSGYVVGISGNLYGGVKTEAEALVSLMGDFDFDENGFVPQNNRIGYEINAKILANMGVNVKAHVLGIFHRKLFQFQFFEFKLGELNHKGETSLDKDRNFKKSNDKMNFFGSKEGVANAPEYKEISDKELINYLSDKNKMILNSGDMKKEIIEEELKKMEKEIIQHLDNIDVLLWNKANIEGQYSQEDYIERMEGKKTAFFSTDKRREAAEEELDKYLKLKEQLDNSKYQMQLVEAFGIEIREKAKHPDKLENNEIDFGQILEDIENKKISLKEGVDKVHDLIREQF